MKNRCAEFFILFVLGSAVSSCSPTSSIADQVVADYIQSSIPAYLQIKNVTLERLAPSETSQSFNFKVTVVPTEALFAATSFDEVREELVSSGLQPSSNGQQMFGGAQYDFKGLDKIQYIRQVNLPTDQVNLYGFVSSRKIVDKIEFSGLSFSSGLEGLGKPKGSFPPGMLIVGSAEFKSRLNSLLESQRRELAAQKAADEQRKAATEKRKAELIEATKLGTRYRGTWTVGASSKMMAARVYRSKDGRPDLECEVHVAG
jgi:hypothetical protein